jgi:hypothetical protein
MISNRRLPQRIDASRNWCIDLVGLARAGDLVLMVSTAIE